MNINNVKLVACTVLPCQYPQNKLPDIALAGRSNVGKSSLINRLANRKSLARVSSSPGKTATVNFYEVDNTVNIVDLPGYGYAKVSKAEKAKWANMIETYLNKREGLINVLQLVDIRHKPTDDDVLMLDWIRRSGFSPVVIATKKDKLKKSQVQGAIDIIKDTLSVDTVIPFSAEKGDECSEVWDVINTILKEAGF